VLRKPSLAEARVTAPQEISALAYEALRLLGRSKLVLEIRSELAKGCRRSEVLDGIHRDELGAMIDHRAQTGKRGRTHPKISSLLSKPPRLTHCPE